MKRAKHKPTGDGMMQRARAAVCLANSAGIPEDTGIRAFMAIFHPELSQAKTDEVVRDVVENRRRRRG